VKSLLGNFLYLSLLLAHVMVFLGYWMDKKGIIFLGDYFLLLWCILLVKRSLSC
jgi:hypothetical protein